jgi:hypothetical protein
LGILDRARNNVGFHWDADVVAPAVSDFGTNQKIIWLESDGEIFVHRLAFEVLGRVLFPEATSRSDEAEIQHAINVGLSNVLDAVKLISTFFVKATLGYLHSIGAEVKRSSAPLSDIDDAQRGDAGRTHERGYRALQRTTAATREATDGQVVPVGCHPSGGNDSVVPLRVDRCVGDSEITTWSDDALVAIT